MRNTMMRVLTELAENDASLTAVIDDTGFQTFEEFEERFPEQFVNVGIAEQQFIGFSAGLAMTGMKVVAYNVCNFYIRAMEQIRVDVCYQETGLVMVGVGGGLYYGTQGPTHHGAEDIALMRAMPNMTVVCPSDPIEMEAALREALSFYRKPVYIRICKNNDPILHTNLTDFKIGKAIVMREGSDVALLATGGMVREALTVAESLLMKGISSRVVSMHTVKPLDQSMVLECAEKFRAVFTLEEHSVIGGLGGAVAEVLLKAHTRPPIFDTFGIPDTFAPVCGTRDYLNALYKLDAPSMVERIVSAIGHTNG